MNRQRLINFLIAMMSIIGLILIMAISVVGQTYKSKHYKIFTSCDKKIVKNEIIPALEAMNSFVCKKLKKDFGIKINLHVRMDVHVYNGGKLYDRKTGRDHRTNPGYTMSISGGQNKQILHICRDDAHTVSPFVATMFHEGCHQIMYANMRDAGAGIPKWLHEGIATYFEGFDFNLKTKKVIKRKPKYLQSRRTQGRSIANEGFKKVWVEPTSALNYGAALIYVEFMMSNKKRHSAFKKALSKGRKTKGYLHYLGEKMQTNKENAKFVKFVKSK